MKGFDIQKNMLPTDGSFIKSQLLSKAIYSFEALSLQTDDKTDLK